jgi:hypothetical protein
VKGAERELHGNSGTVKSSAAALAAVQVKKVFELFFGFTIQLLSAATYAITRCGTINVLPCFSRFPVAVRRGRKVSRELNKKLALAGFPLGHERPAVGIPFVHGGEDVKRSF